MALAALSFKLPSCIFSVIHQLPALSRCPFSASVREERRPRGCGEAESPPCPSGTHCFPSEDGGSRKANYTPFWQVLYLQGSTFYEGHKTNKQTRKGNPRSCLALKSEGKINSHKPPLAYSESSRFLKTTASSTTGLLSRCNYQPEWHFPKLVKKRRHWIKALTFKIKRKEISLSFL